MDCPILPPVSLPDVDPGTDWADSLVSFDVIDDANLLPPLSFRGSDADDSRGDLHDGAGPTHLSQWYGEHLTGLQPGKIPERRASAAVPDTPGTSDRLLGQSRKSISS